MKNNPRLEAELKFLGDACRNAGLVRVSFAQALLDELSASQAKLSERKTVHEWLNASGIPQEENWRKLCLLRRLRIACDKLQMLHIPDEDAEAVAALLVMRNGLRKGFHNHIGEVNEMASGKQL